MGAYMAAAEGMFTGILILAVIILSVNMVLCLVRAVLGPRFSDRLIAINMIGTKTVLIIALLIKVFHEDYLVDICLIYALISFLSFVVLTKLLDQRMNRGKGNAGEKHAGREYAGKGAKHDTSGCRRSFHYIGSVCAVCGDLWHIPV